MSATRFRLRGEPERRLDLSALTPHRLAGLDEAAVARLKLAGGRDAPSVGDLFELSAGDAGTVVIEGGSPLLDHVGAGLEGGSLVLEGDAGDYAGRGMTGGRLEVRGSAGRLAASGLRGGAVEIAGNAGALLAGPLPGERAGMDGGTVLLRGSAGPQACDRMRRGLVVVEGDAGPQAASRMIAGTLVVCGRVGASPGMLLRRGTMVLGHAVPAPDGFLPSGHTPGVFRTLLTAWLRALSPAAGDAAARAGRRLLGDQATLGRGEMLMPREPPG